MISTNRASYNKPHISIGDKTRVHTKQALIDKASSLILLIEQYAKHTNLHTTDIQLLCEARDNLSRARRNMRIMIAK